MSNRRRWKLMAVIAAAFAIAICACMYAVERWSIAKAESFDCDVYMNQLSSWHCSCLSKEFDDASLASIAASLRNLNIEALFLSGTAITDESSKVLCQFSDLRSLDVSRTSLTDATVIALKDIGSLVQLDVSFSCVSGGGLGGIAALTDLSICGLRVSDKDFSDLAQLLHLKHLTASGLCLVDVRAETLSALTQVRYLYLTGSDVTDQTLLKIHQWRTLEAVVLSKTSVTNDGVQILRSRLNDVVVDVR